MRYKPFDQRRFKQQAAVAAFARDVGLPALSAEAAQKLVSLQEFKIPRLMDYFLAVWPILEPETPLTPNWHHEVICEYLEAVTRGEIKRLLINIPPRTLKSTLGAIVWPTWEWLQFPHYRYIFASYAQSLATLHSVGRRTVLESPYYRTNYGSAFFLTSDHNQKMEFLNNHRGIMSSTSFGGTATGKGGNRVVVDDPHDAQAAFSENTKTNDARFFKRLLTRLNDPNKDAIIVICQRVAQEDVSDICISLGYTHLKLPARATPKTRMVYLPSGKLFKEREIGESLDESRLSPNVLKEIEETLDSNTLAAQFGQEPVPEGGGIFKEEWFAFVDSLPTGLEWVRFWDCAVSKKDSADFTASIAVAFEPNTHTFYMRDLVHERMTTLDVEAKIVHWIAREADTVNLVEVDGIGEPIFQHLAIAVKTMNRYLLAAPKQQRDKVMRARMWQGRAQAGRFKIYDPERAWSGKFLKEVTNFRADLQHAHDDIVDSVSGAYDWFAHRYARQLAKSLDDMIKEARERENEA